jgi:hypothetical protein
MGISSFECHNKHLPGSRGKSFWEYATGAPEDFFFIDSEGQQHQQIHRNYILPGQECEI